MARFIAFDRNQQFLLPPSIDDWLPEDHLARYIVEVVDQLDLSKLTCRYSHRGSEAYHPSLMLGLLVYGYATGVFSSRKIERATYDSVAFRFIAANLHPDHDTLAHFRRTFLVELEDLFIQVLSIAKAMKLVKLGTLSLDGTKIKANASKHKALSHGHIEKLEARLRREVQALLAKAAETDQQEAGDACDLPSEMARREDRLKALAEAKAKIAERAEQRHQEAKKAYDAKVAQREAKLAAGKKPRGKMPKAPETDPRDKDQINLTDEESRVMPSREGFLQAYNGQAAVDVTSMLIVAARMTQETNDKQQVIPILDALANLPGDLGKPDTLLADNGYFSQSNIKACHDHHITPLIALGREAHHLPLEERLAADLPEPQTEDPLIKMAHTLKTKEGRACYGKRKCTVEPVFGIIKHVMGFRQFSLRGLQAISGEWTMVAIAYNLKRMHVLSAI